MIKREVIVERESGGSEESVCLRMDSESVPFVQSTDL